MSRSSRHDLRTWNLQQIIRGLLQQAPAISAIYLFGSRAYGTGSLRSDIDLLAVTDLPLRPQEIVSWLTENFNPVDLFETTDGRIARSLMNGSAIMARECALPVQLDAKLLWSRDHGFSEEFTLWEQPTLRDAHFAMTILPIASTIMELANNFQRRIAQEGYPSTFLGSDWKTIGENLCQVMRHALDTPSRLGRRAKNITGQTITIRNEYDFQNLIHLVLRPWLPSIEPENTTIRYQDQDKLADFGINKNTIIIEAKHIHDDNSKREVLKDLEGLKDFYMRNPNVRLLLFFILIDRDVEIDSAIIEHDHSNVFREPVVIVKCFDNVLDGKN